MAAMWAGDLDSPGGVLAAAEAARAAPPGPEPPRAVDVLLDALALRLTEGYAAAAPTLTRALELVLAPEVGTDEAGRWLWLAGSRPSAAVAVELWDAESWHFLAARQVQVARDTGALVQLRLALNFVAGTHLLAGELTTAALMIEEDRLIAEATGNPPITYTEMMLAAWRGQEARASELIEATLREATARGLGRFVLLASYASSVLDNGLGRHDAARDAAWRAFERDLVGFGPFVVPELAEAASRTGDVALVRAALEWLSERTRVTPSEWALGIEARVRALLSEGDVADSLYRESIERLGRTRVRVELARAIWSTASGCAARTGESMRASSCGRRTRCSRRWGRRRSPTAPAASCWPRARPCASAPWKRAASSPPRRLRSRGSPATGSRTRRSAPGCSSVRAPSSTTCARSSSSSTSARAPSSTASCPATRPTRSPL